MNTSKRTYNDVDPDYVDVCEQQTKRQKELEQDAKQSVGRRIQSIVRNEFRKEINNKELELHQVDKKLNEARLMMDRLRACIISTYYGQTNQSGTSEVSKMSGPPSSIHPTIKKHIGKRPSHYELSSDFTLCHLQQFSKPELLNKDHAEFLHQRSDGSQEQQSKISARSSVYQSPPPADACNTSPFEAHGVTYTDTTYDDRRARFKIKKKIIVGNISKYIPVDHREVNDKSSHKWMVYVRGPKSEPNISGFVKKVWFFLHHSYKPNDLIEISCPPFHLTRRGWGEFPVRIQLHFVDPRNKKVDIIHHLKLDKTFSGLQTLGAETTVELDLEKDCFEPDTRNCDNSTRPTLDGSSKYCQSQLHSNADSSAPKITLGNHSTVLQNEVVSLPERCQMSLSNRFEPEGKGIYSATDVLDDSFGVQSGDDRHNNCLIEVCDNHQIKFDNEVEAISLENNVQSLEEYNVTIIHETVESADNRQKEKNMVVDTTVMVSNKLIAEQENISVNSSEMQNQSNCVSASLMKKQPTLSLGTISTKAALTVINRPQWISSDNSYIADKNNRHTLHPSDLTNHPSGTFKALNIFTTASRVNNLSVISVTSAQQSSTITPQVSQTAQKVQPNSYTVMSANELCLKQSSSHSLSSMVQVVKPPISCSGHSSTQISLPSTQNIIVNASSTFDNARSSIEPCEQPLSQAHQVKENRLPYISDVQKVIVLKSNASSTLPELFSNNTTENRSLQQSKPSGPRQVSLLTGKVFTPQTSGVSKISSISHENNESLLANHCAIAKQESDQTAVSGNHVTKCVSMAGNQILLLKSGDHPLLASKTMGHLVNYPFTLTNQITDLNGLITTSQMENVSILNAEDSTENPIPMSLIGNSGAGNISKIETSHNKQVDVRRTNVVLHVPEQEQSRYAYPKMSAIGMTKFGKNSTTVLIPHINSRSTTDEERKKNQYEVLMAWKRNCLLHEKVKEVKTSRDRIEGEADIISELNLDDYTNMRALVKATVKLHPLIEAGINKLTHPYCAESIDEWATWTLGKQLASEWHRACFVLKYLKPLLEKSDNFKGEKLMTTRQLVHWCRLHAFSPLTAVLKAKPVSTDFDRFSYLQCNSSHNSSFTPVHTFKIDMLAEVSVFEPEANIVCDGHRQDIMSTADTNEFRQLTNRIPELDDNTVNEWLPPSNGAHFVFDELRKRGVRLQPNKLQPDVMSFTAADMLYRVMEEFLSDVLRETVAVSSWQNCQRSNSEVTRRDVHQALTQLPEAAFSCNRFMGKADFANGGNGR